MKLVFLFCFVLLFTARANRESPVSATAVRGRKHVNEAVSSEGQQKCAKERLKTANHRTESGRGKVCTDGNEWDNKKKMTDEIVG